MEEKKLYDDCFYVEKAKYGMWRSYDKEDKPLVTSLDELSCVLSTRQYLQVLQEKRINDVGVSSSK